jgi:cell wall-associated protease
MRFFKPLYVTSVIAIALVGCKAVNTIPVPTGTNNIIVLSAKKAPLTKTQRETWGHADLATDKSP